MWLCKASYPPGYFCLQLLPVIWEVFFHHILTFKMRNYFIFYWQGGRSVWEEWVWRWNVQWKLVNCVLQFDSIDRTESPVMQVEKKMGLLLDGSGLCCDFAHTVTFVPSKGAASVKYFRTFPLLTDAGWVSSLVADDQMCCKRVQLLPFCPGCVLLGLGIERRLCDDLPEQNLFPEHQLTREVG